MKILIFGGHGWIGQQFVNIVKEDNINYIVSKVRCDNFLQVYNEFVKEKPTHVISFIGRTHGKIGEKHFPTIDYLEQKYKLQENIRDNLYGPIILSLLCKEFNIHFTYLGTGCIFEFDEQFTLENGCKEHDEPNFFGSSYSTVKGFTDRIMHLFETNTLNLRIRMPITEKPNPRNFITKITTYEKICSMSNSMSVLPELLPYIPKLMKMKQTGTLNFTNPGSISHNEILTMFRDLVDPTFTWENFSKEEQDKIIDSKRSNNFLDTSKLQELFPEIRNIKSSILYYLEIYKQHYVPLPKIKNNVKNLLVTGGNGFIGSNFINYFMENYDNVRIVNIDAMYYCAREDNIKETIRKADNYVFVRGNLNSSDMVRHILNSYNIDHVIHFAAQSHVQNSFEDSLLYTQDNIMGTHVLLEEVRKYGRVQKFIHVSTDEVYGESMFGQEEERKTEQSILCPTNPYAATKAGAELIAQAYQHSFQLPIIITRGNNVYGPNQYPEKVVPRFIQQIKEGKKITIQGDGSALRSFLHVEDTSRAFEIILQKGKIGEIYNICSEEEYSVKDVARIIISNIHPLPFDTSLDKYVTYVEDRPFNDKRYHISGEKLKNLGWKVEWNFEKGIKDLMNL
jgi:dTDP-glucose 4,6-dehydratase